MSKIMNCLWFDTDAEAAAELYTSLVPNSSVGGKMHAGADFPGGKAGDLLTVDFVLDGVQFQGLNGRSSLPESDRVSFTIACEDQAEVDRLWSGLTANGGREVQCGWLKDRWGFAWQIVPKALMRGMTDPDPAVAKRVMEAMMGMVKIDIAGIEAAIRG